MDFFRANGFEFLVLHQNNLIANVSRQMRFRSINIFVLDLKSIVLYSENQIFKTYYKANLIFETYSI